MKNKAFKALGVAANVWKKHGPTILTVGGVVGLVTTSVLAGRASVKASKRLEAAKAEEPDKRLSKMDVVKLVAYDYVPAMVSCAVTSACIIGSNAANAKRYATLLDAYTLTSSALKLNKDQTLMTWHESAKKRIEGDFPSVKGVVRFKESYLDEEFEDTFENVLLAEYNLNRVFILKDYATFGEFRNMLGLRRVPDTDDIGWSCRGEVDYGYRWVDFVHRKKVDDKGEYYEIEYPFPPTRDFLD